LGLLNAWKAAKIARAVEKDIMPRMAGHLLFNYKTTYAWGTEGGNHIFDQVAQRSRKARLSEIDDYILSLLYLVLQAREDDNPGGERGFERMLLDVLPQVIENLSVGVLSEVFIHIDTTKGKLTSP